MYRVSIADSHEDTAEVVPATRAPMVTPTP